MQFSYVKLFLNNDNNHLFHINGYQLVQKCRQNKGKGGVALYIKDTYSFKIRDDLSMFLEGEFESIFIETSNNSKCHVIIGEIYRTPHSNPKLSVDRYNSLLSKLDRVNTDVVIGTDQNLDLLKIDTNECTGELLDSFFAAGILPRITRPTIITDTSATLIDNLYIRHLKRCTSGILISDISDHFPIFSALELERARQRLMNR